jgi:hypothetical protein
MVAYLKLGLCQAQRAALQDFQCPAQSSRQEAKLNCNPASAFFANSSTFRELL